MNELKNKIIDSLNYFKDRWACLTDPSNECLNNRIVTMEIAINVINKIFELPPDRTLYEQIMSEMTIGKMAILRIIEDNNFIYTTDGTSFDKNSVTAFTDAVRHEIYLLNQPVYKRS